ncbi:hypothetical protein [Micromonospora sp. NPDC049274]|uniref:hypothetical protein n=1 Tax=Micromonospora sp. NPDC049274 TaxID=3154829 RepID=UPI00342A66FA
MPEPQPGARPADGRTPGPEPDDAPAVADESTSPPVPPDQPAAPDQSEPTAEPPARSQPEPAAEPAPTAQEPEAQPDPTAPEPKASAGPTAQAGSADSPVAPTVVPAPRWSGSAPVPPPLPRRRAWGESAEPTPPPLPEQPPEHRTPVDPWAGVDTGGWDLPSAELPPLPPTLDYPAPPSTRQWSGPPAPPVGTHPVSPSPAHPAASAYPTSPAYPAPAYPVPPAHPVPPARPTPPAQPGTARPTAPVRPVPPARAPKQRRGGRSATPPPVTPPPGWEAPKGYVPVPVRRRRRWPWLLLLTLACCCGCPAYYGLPISSQYPARAALPEQVVDLSLRQDDGSAATARQLENEVRQEHWLAEDTFAGVYDTADGKQVTVFGGTGFRLNPEADADAEITRLTDRYALEAPETVQTSVRGRHERCAIGRPADGDVVVCTSVDHGSIATGVFTRLSVPDSADLLNTLRSQIVQPEKG